MGIGKQLNYNKLNNNNTTTIRRQQRRRNKHVQFVKSYQQPSPVQSYTVYWELDRTPGLSDREMLEKFELPFEKLQQLFKFCHDEEGIMLHVSRCDSQVIEFRGKGTRANPQPNGCQSFRFVRTQWKEYDDLDNINLQKFWQCRTNETPYTIVVQAALLLIKQANADCSTLTISDNFDNTAFPDAQNLVDTVSLLLDPFNLEADKSFKPRKPFVSERSIFWNQQQNNNNEIPQQQLPPVIVNNNNNLLHRKKTFSMMENTDSDDIPLLIAPNTTTTTIVNNNNQDDENSSSSSNDDAEDEFTGQQQICNQALGAKAYLARKAALTADRSTSKKKKRKINNITIPTTTTTTTTIVPQHQTNRWFQKGDSERAIRQASDDYLNLGTILRPYQSGMINNNYNHRYMDDNEKHSSFMVKKGYTSINAQNPQTSFQQPKPVYVSSFHLSNNVPQYHQVYPNDRNPFCGQGQRLGGKKD